jgi:aspartate/methionine/tyrosine aminotransferase
MKKFDLTWGESVCVRTAFLETLGGAPVIFGYDQFEQFGYPKHEGHPELIELTKKVIKRQTGRTYKHVLLTNGATGAATITLRTLKQRGHNTCFTRTAPYFSIYPSMIKAAGFERHVTEGHDIFPGDKCIGLIDSPTNPQGIFVSGRVFTDPVIWDAVYHNKVYTSERRHEIPGHDIVVGSYSKLLGINGIRVGWIAFNDDSLYNDLYKNVTAEYCGLSHASTHILLTVLKEFYWEQFEQNARYQLDFNRGEWSKLEKYFGDHPVSKVGMFYYAYMDKACKKLMEKSGVLWMPGTTLGADDDFGRINLGQDNRLILNAVKEVLKIDKIK